MGMYGVIICVTKDEAEWLRGADEEAIAEKIDAWQDADRALHLDKMWNAMHYALTGKDFGGSGPTSFITNDDYGDKLAYEFSYGAARLFPPAETRAIAEAVNGVPQGTLRERLGTERLDEVYPFSIRGADEDDRESILKRLSELHAYLDDAVAKGMGLIVGVD